MVSAFASWKLLHAVIIHLFQRRNEYLVDIVFTKVADTHHSKETVLVGLACAVRTHFSLRGTVERPSSTVDDTSPCEQRKTKVDKILFVKPKEENCA